jgi:hypothetical protein
MAMVRRKLLELSGGLTAHNLLHGEKPDIYNLPRPSSIIEFVDERMVSYLRWRASWQGEERCLEVKRTASSNLLFYKDLLRIYLDKRGKLEDYELDYLVGLTQERIDRWSYICERIDDQLDR